MLTNIFLTIIIFLLIYYIFRLKRDIRNISNQIYESKGEYINIKTLSIDNDIEKLAVRINYLYDKSQEVKAKNKSIEEELRRSIANMSHDLRTPLTSIMGYIQLIKSDDFTEGEKLEFIEIVERRTKKLQKLISSFYDLSRLDSNEYKFNLKKVSLNKILCDNIATYYNDFIIKNIEPVIKIKEDISDIISDEGAINRVFSNLIGNMIKHGSGDFEINLREDTEYLISEFKNKAVGLSEENVEKLFQRFYTVDNSRSDRNTGIGLSITKALVKSLGSEIKAKLLDDELTIEIRWRKV